MCTFNGEKYLREQLESFKIQKDINWELHISDDGSTDETLNIIQEFSSKNKKNKIYLYEGPRKGYAKNFLSLVSKVSTKVDYFAFSDQDDIWFDSKLKKSVAELSKKQKNIPLLYCSRTLLVNASNEVIGCSPIFMEKPSFKNALMQNIAGGNTMVFNNKTRELIKKVSEGLDQDVVSHDWLVYILVSACGGEISFDKEPSLRYRQHSSNIIGMNSSWRAKIKRIDNILRGEFKHWNDLNISVLRAVYSDMTVENRCVLDLFNESRKSSLIQRIVGIKKSGVKRQTLMGNIWIFFAVFFNKI